MDDSFPYTRYVCPCSDTTAAPPSVLGKRTSRSPDSDDGSEREAFNPHDPRASFSLHPIDHLLFCNECDQPRCPKCWTEEMIHWYCPSCQFEVPSSSVKADGNRCARNCYDCPICSAALAVTAVTTSKSQSDSHLRPEDHSTSSESYILQCHSCDWTTLDIGVRFARHTKITEQLNKVWRERIAGARKDGDEKENGSSEPLSHESAFANLTGFYREQLTESSDQPNPYSNSPYNSPANLARIMSIYGGLSHTALKKSREKPQPMREARNQAEGLATFSIESVHGESEVLRRMQTLGLDGTTTATQRLAAPRNCEARFTDQLWPVATPLRVRRGKRCGTCRQFIARPEPKVGSMRYKIRLLAVNFIQRLSVRPIQSSDLIQSAAFHLRTEPRNQVKLKPHQTHQYILTVRNPIFESVKVTLATPGITPGKVASRVTILCPSFTVGPAGDMWDEALSSSTAATSDGGRRAAMESLTGSADADRQPEAGKIWERSRNSTSVIIEIVPGALKPPPSIVPKTEQELADEQLAEDDDVLEVPIYVRAEWEADVHETVALPAADHKKRENKELAYWCVVGIGRTSE